MEIFKIISDGLQNIALVVAAIVGGIWVAYTFRAQRKADQSRAELEKLTLDNQRVPALRIEISGKQVAVPGDNHLHILISLIIRNTGNKSTCLCWSPEPISVAQVIVHDHGTPTLKPVSRTAIYLLSEKKMRTGYAWYKRKSAALGFLQVIADSTRL